MSNLNEETYDSLENHPFEYFLIHLLQHDEWNKIAHTLFCDENFWDKKNSMASVMRRKRINEWRKEWEKLTGELPDWFGEDKWKTYYNKDYYPEDNENELTFRLYEYCGKNYPPEDSCMFRYKTNERLKEFLKNESSFTETEFCEFCKEEYKEILKNNEIASNIKWQQPEHFTILYKEIKSRLHNFKEILIENIEFDKEIHFKEKIIPFSIQFKGCFLKKIKYDYCLYESICFNNCKIEDFYSQYTLKLKRYFFSKCTLSNIEFNTSNIIELLEREYVEYVYIGHQSSHFGGNINIKFCIIEMDNNGYYTDLFLSDDNTIHGDLEIEHTEIKGNFYINHFGSNKFFVKGNFRLDKVKILDGSLNCYNVEFEKKLSIVCDNFFCDYNTHFSEQIILHNCHFKDEVEISNVYFEKGISLKDSVFEQKVDFKSIKIKSQNINDGFDFYGTIFKKIFKMEIEDRQDIFYNINLKNAVFEDNCIFHYIHHINASSFKKEILNKKLSIHFLDCSSSQFKKGFKLSEHNTKRNMKLSISIHQAIFFGAKFEQIFDLREIKFITLPDFRGIECKGGIEFSDKLSIDESYWNNIQNTNNEVSSTLKWGALRKLASKHNNFEYEAFFFNQEMKAKIQESSGIIKWLIVLYGFLSCYGMNIKRPLMGMFVIFGAFFFINLSIIIQHDCLAYILAGFFIAILSQFIKQVSQDPVKSISIQMITPCLISLTFILCFVLLSSSILINSSQILPTHSETYSVTGIEENVHNLKISQHKEISFVGKAFENTLDASFSFLSLKPKSEDTGATFKLFRCLQALMTLILTFLTALGIRNILRFRGGSGSS